MLTSKTGAIDAFGASLIWGFAFITLRWSTDAYGPLWVRSFSLFLVALALIPIFLLKGRQHKALDRKHLSMTFFPGLALGLCLCLQSVGMKYTSVANSGFLTVLSVVFVPIGEMFFYGTKIRMVHGFAVLMALLGAILLCGGLPNEWNRGDLFTLGCAFMSACHFLILQKVAKNTGNPFTFNVLQMCWAGILTLPLSIWLEPFPEIHLSAKPILSLLFLGLGSMMIGFMLHVRAQRNLSATVTSLICLLEAPFASFFAVLFLNESMSFAAIAGAAVIVGAAGIAALTPLKT